MRRVVILVLALCSAGFAQEIEPGYLLSMAQETSGRTTCVLLQNSGNFHVEVLTLEADRIFEGQLSSAGLKQITQLLDSSAFTSLSQAEIEEPLVGDFYSRLHLKIFRQDHWQELDFQSGEAEKNYKHTLQPLVRWLDDLHKLPHQNLTEEEGRNNCQVPRKLELKQRPAFSAEDRAPKPARKLPPPHLDPAPAPAFRSETHILFRMVSFDVASKGAHQQCMLAVSDGRYRFEDRFQKSGKSTVESRAADGRMEPVQVAELQSILNNPVLSRIKHHEPPGGLQVRMMGNILRLWITRDQGVQHIVLSRKQWQTGFFYTGDGDTQDAGRLQQFISEHIEKNGTAPATGAQLNECTSVAQTD